MKVRDVMTEGVVSVSPDATLKEVAELLSGHRISGLPVVDGERRVVGVVSEADIVRREAGDDRTRGVLGWLLLERPPARLDARTAGEAMTSPPIVIRPDRDVADAARLMTEQVVNRLPVVDADQRIVGIVTRADLVRVFVRSDEEIARELRDDVLVDTLWIDPASVEITVENGDVALTGEVATKADVRLLAHFASRVPGVVSVRSELRWRVDEPRLPQSDPRVPAPPRT